MAKLIVFNNVSLDGYFTDKNGDMSWAHFGSDDAEFSSFVQQNASGGGILLFGATTYRMMASYWPTALASERDPVVAEAMNSRQKFVFSRKMDKAEWKNTTVVNGNIADEVRKLKNADGPGLAILGSGSIVAQLAAERLIDEYQVVVIPVVLGAGRTMFDGLPTKMNLQLSRTRAFKNGKVFIAYEPVRT